MCAARRARDPGRRGARRGVRDAGPERPRARSATCAGARGQRRDAPPDGARRGRRRHLSRRRDLAEGRRRADRASTPARCCETRDRVSRAPAGWQWRRRAHDSPAAERQLPVAGEQPGDADADEPQRARPVAQTAVEQRQASSPIRSVVVDRRGSVVERRADREVGVAELRRHRSRGEPLALRGSRRPRPPSAAAPRAAPRGRRGRARTSPRPRSRSARRSSSRSRGSIPRARSRSTRPTWPGSTARSSTSVERGELADRRDARRASRSSARGPTPGSSARRERREEPRLGPGRHDRDPARLAPVRRDLADDLRRRDAEGARERVAPADGDLHCFGEPRGRRRTT